MKDQEAKKLEEKVVKTLAKYIKTPVTIIAAISGGPDSIFLLKQLQKSDNQIIVAHINHKLRPESEEEEAFVKKLCTESPNTKFQCKKLPKLASQKGNLENNAREARYQFFNELAEKQQAKFILTAHHANDNLETILLKFTRGASLEGLSGIKEQSGKLLRPLLNISKAEILDYLDTKGIPYHLDPSNEDKKFSRNFLRQELIPKLQHLNPSLEKTVSKNSKNLSEIADYIAEEAKNWINTHKKNEELPSKEFLKLHPALQKSILRERYKKLTANTQNLETIHIEECLQLIQNNIGNKKKKLGNATLSIQKGQITLKIS